MIINGKTTSNFSAFDRGLQYGDGLFETLAVMHGHPCLWTRHMDRLELGCEKLKIAFPGRALLRQEVDQLIAEQDQAVLKITLTRGPSVRGYKIPDPCLPTRIVSVQDWPDFPDGSADNGVLLRWCETRLGINASLAGIKHLNRLEQVLARNEWMDSTIAEGLMLDQNDQVVEGTMSNLFLVKNQKLITPPIDRCGVAGVMRGLVIDVAKSLNLNVRIEVVMQQDVAHADAVFMTNSLIGIWPVKGIKDMLYNIEEIPVELRQRVQEQQYRV